MPTETPPPFVPFAPNFQPPALAPTETGETTAKRRSKQKKKVAAKQVPDAPAKPPRKRAAAKPKRTAKYDLQTILKIAGTLKEADQPVFEKMLGELSALAKGSRERVLKALGEVFG